MTSRYISVPPQSVTSTGKALLAQRTPVNAEPEEHTDVDLDQLEDLQDYREDGDPVGAVHWGASPLVRSLSLGSCASSGGSSEIVYRTTPLTRSPSVQPPSRPMQERKVFLPHRVPFPAATGPRGPARPCIGCGKVGHWIANCPSTNPQVKEMAWRHCARAKLRDKRRMLHSKLRLHRINAV